MKKYDTKIIDAGGLSLGRVASTIAMSLMGKTKATFERNVYSGVPVKVINVSKIKITSKKLGNTARVRYSGHRGGLRTIKWSETVEKKGMDELLKLAVFQMLPGNKLRREMMKNLTIEK